MTPKSLAEVTGFNVAPRKYMLMLCGSMFNICLVPRKRSLVLSGFMSKCLSHITTGLHCVRRSCSSFSIAASSSIDGKDRNNFESSTYDSRLQELVAKEIQNSSGDKIAP